MVQPSVIQSPCGNWCRRYACPRVTRSKAMGFRRTVQFPFTTACVDLSRGRAVAWTQLWWIRPGNMHLDVWGGVVKRSLGKVLRGIDTLRIQAKRQLVAPLKSDLVMRGAKRRILTILCEHSRKHSILRFTEAVRGTLGSIAAIETPHQIASHVP